MKIKEVYLFNTYVLDCDMTAYDKLYAYSLIKDSDDLLWLDFSLGHNRKQCKVSDAWPLPS